jgi:integrase
VASASIENVNGKPRYIRIQEGSGDTRTSRRVPLPKGCGVREAERLLTKTREQLDQGNYLRPDQMITVSTFFHDHYMPMTRNRNSPKTINRKLSDFALHVEPIIGDCPLDDVLVSVVGKWRNTLDDPVTDEEGNVKPGLAQSTQRIIYQMMASVFDLALEDDWIKTNPFKSKRVDKPASSRVKKIEGIWAQSWVNGMRAELERRYRIVVTIGAGLGLRAGEIFGLALEDLDFTPQEGAPHGVARINRQVKIADRAPSVASYGPPKTENGYREVPLSRGVVAALRAHMDEFPPLAVTLPYRSRQGRAEGEQTHHLIVTTAQDHHVNKNVFSNRKWRPARRALGIPDTPDNGLHALRHFYGSIMINSHRSDFAAVARWMGHAGPHITIGQYLHEQSSTANLAPLDAVFGLGDTGDDVIGVLSEPAEVTGHVSQKRAKVVDLGKRRA